MVAVKPFVINTFGRYYISIREHSLFFVLILFFPVMSFVPLPPFFYIPATENNNMIFCGNADASPALPAENHIVRATILLNHLKAHHVDNIYNSFNMLSTHISG